MSEKMKMFTDKLDFPHWEELRMSYGELSGWYICSQCSTITSHQTNFCPNCGAEMAITQIISTSLSKNGNVTSI